jgi:anti-anti-sigma regulatory factor
MLTLREDLRPLTLRLRRLRGVVYVNAAGCMDQDSGLALIGVVEPLLTGTSIRRVLVDLCDVDRVDRYGWEAIERLRTTAETHARQLAVLTSSPRREDLYAAELRRRSYAPRMMSGASPWRPSATVDVLAA